MTTITKSIEPRLFSLRDGESKVGRFLVLLGWCLWTWALILPAMYGLGSPLDGGGGGVGPLWYGIQCLIDSLMIGWICPWAWPIIASHILIFSSMKLLARRERPRSWVKVMMICIPPTAMVSTNVFSDEILVGGWMWLVSLVLVGCGFVVMCEQAEARVKRAQQVIC